MIGAKIRAIREEKGLSQKDFASQFGISYGTLQSYEYGETQPKANFLKSIAEYFNIDISFFYEKESRQSVAKVSPNNKNSVANHLSLKTQNDLSISPEKSEKLQKLQALMQEQENKLINLRFFPNVSAAAGYGANNDNESFESIPVTASFLTTILRLPAKQYDVINVLGNSMEPFLKDGDMVLVFPTHEASNGEIVIANLGGDLYVKKLLKDPIKKRIRLTSMNELYEDIVVEDDELDQLKIVGVVKKVLPSGAISI